MLEAKNTYDSFINTILASWLEQKKIERVVVCGVMADACCDTTARSAASCGYGTWLASDAYGSANKKQHEAGLAGSDFLFAGVVTTKEAIAKLDGKGERRPVHFQRRETMELRQLFSTGVKLSD